MDTADDELVDELRDLTGRLRDQLARHASLGAWAAPGGATARDALLGAADRAGDEASPEVVEPGHAQPVPSDPDPERHRAHVVERPQAMDVRGDPAVDAGDPPIPLGRRTLADVRADLGECTRCKLHTTRRSIVFGVGAPDAPLMFVGEAPGEQEDRRGEPFVGPAGQLLDKMIEAMGWTRDTVYIANTTKCRPPNNRNPQPDELAQCMPFLHAQIAAVAPRIIVALGKPASNQLLGTDDTPISALRGRFHDYARFALDRHALKIMPTFHPAALLRDPDKKRAVWSDLKLVIAELGRLGIAAPKPH